MPRLTKADLEEKVKELEAGLANANTLNKTLQDEVDDLKSMFWDGRLVPAYQDKNNNLHMCGLRHIWRPTRRNPQKSVTKVVVDETSQETPPAKAGESILAQEYYVNHISDCGYGDDIFRAQILRWEAERAERGATPREKDSYYELFIMDSDSEESYDSFALGEEINVLPKDSEDVDKLFLV